MPGLRRLRREGDLQRHPFSRCDMETFIPGEYRQDKALREWTAGAWKRCPRPPAFRTTKGWVVCEPCALWAAETGYEIPGLFRALVDGEDPDRLVSMRLALPKRVYDLVQRKAEQEEISAPEWVREVLRRELLRMVARGGAAD